MQLNLPALPHVPAKPPADGRYIVRSGDTLSVIAERMKVPGGREALYAANRTTIGADPNRLVVGTVLVPPAAQATPAAAKPAAAAPAATTPAATEPAATTPTAKTPAAATAPAAPAAPANPVEPAGQGPAPRPALLANPPHGAPVVIRTPPAAEVPAQPPAYPEPEPINKTLVAGLLGAAFVLFVILIVYAVLPMRDPDKRAMRKGQVLSGPSSSAAGALASFLRHEPRENQIVVPDQRTPELPLRIVLDKPEKDSEGSESGSDSKRLSA
jgi:hypothetical protein